MALKPEQKTWRNHLKPALDKIPGLSYERAELSTGASGMPDLVYSLGGTGFIENKHNPSQEGVDLRGWRQVQRTWAKRWSRSGARIFLFASGPGGAYLVDAARCVQERYLPDGHGAILAHWPDCRVSHLELADLIRIN